VNVFRVWPVHGWVSLVFLGWFYCILHIILLFSSILLFPSSCSPVSLYRYMFYNPTVRYECVFFHNACWRVLYTTIHTNGSTHSRHWFALRYDRIDVVGSICPVFSWLNVAPSVVFARHQLIPDQQTCIATDTSTTTKYLFFRYAFFLISLFLVFWLTCYCWSYDV
jgi:hypothetical protein